MYRYHEDLRGKQESYEPFLVTALPFEPEPITDERLREHLPHIEFNDLKQDIEADDRLEEEQVRFLKNIQDKAVFDVITLRRIWNFRKK